MPALKVSPLAKTVRAKAFASFSVSNVLAVRFTFPPSGTKETYQFFASANLRDLRVISTTDETISCDGPSADAELLADLEDAMALIPERHDLSLDGWLHPAAVLISRRWPWHGRVLHSLVPE